MPFTKIVTSVHVAVTLRSFSSPNYETIKTEHRGKPLSLYLYLFDTYSDKTCEKSK